jgi:hypothetical protein
LRYLPAPGELYVLVEFLKLLDAAYPANTAIKLI